MYDVIIVGGGPAGISAAIGAEKIGVKVLIIERDIRIGGILNQCIHTGFGMELFGEELTGTEYAARLKAKIAASPLITVQTCTTCLSVVDNGEYKSVTVSSENGYEKIFGSTVILTTGCREKSAGSISLPGSRPVGIFTAGMAQKLCNIDGYLVGQNVVIVGSGDIGLIMARRMTYEGAKVIAVIEIMPYSSGLKRNIVQCLDDYNIPLYLSHTVTAVEGKERVTAIRYARVDEKMRPIMSTEKTIQCDTLLLSVGLASENEIISGTNIEMSQITGGATVNEWYMTTIDGIFAAGNCLHVNDLVDNVASEATLAGIAAAKYAKNEIMPSQKYYNVLCGSGLRYVLPQRVGADGNHEKNIKFFMRAAFPSAKGKLIASIMTTTDEPCAQDSTTNSTVAERLTKCETLANIFDSNNCKIAEKSLRAISPGEMIEFSIPSSKIIGDITISLTETPQK